MIFIFYSLGPSCTSFTTTKLLNAICSMFSKNQDIHCHYTRQCNEFHQTYARTTLAPTNFKHEGPKLWNSLNVSLRNIPNASLLKFKFKTQLIGKYSQAG